MARWTFPIGHPASTRKLTQSISCTDSVLSSPFQISRHCTKAPNKKAPGWKSKLVDLHCLPSNSFQGLGRVCVSPSWTWPALSPHHSHTLSAASNMLLTGPIPLKTISLSKANTLHPVFLSQVTSSYSLWFRTRITFLPTNFLCPPSNTLGQFLAEFQSMWIVLCVSHPNYSEHPLSPWGSRTVVSTEWIIYIYF